MRPASVRQLKLTKCLRLSTEALYRHKRIAHQAHLSGYSQANTSKWRNPSKCLQHYSGACTGFHCIGSTICIMHRSSNLQTNYKDTSDAPAGGLWISNAQFYMSTNAESNFHSSWKSLVLLFNNWSLMWINRFTKIFMSKCLSLK